MVASGVGSPRRQYVPGGKGKGGKVTRHGVTTTGYQRGCRCAKCVKAMRDYDRKRRAAKVKVKP